jgi:hypothetical protein
LYVRPHGFREVPAIAASLTIPIIPWTAFQPKIETQGTGIRINAGCKAAVRKATQTRSANSKIRNNKHAEKIKNHNKTHTRHLKHHICTDESPQVHMSGAA